MANALTYLAAILGGGATGFAKGYTEAETERKARAKELLMEAMSMDAPAARVGALYKAANEPGTIESLFGAKGPSESDVGAYSNAYGSKMARKSRKEALDFFKGRLRPETEKAMFLESQAMDKGDTMPVAPPVTAPAPPPVTQAPPVASPAPPVVTPERRAEGDSMRVPGTIRDESMIGQTVGQAMGDANAERILEERRKGMVFTLPGDHSGMLAPGNIDLDSRKVLKNKDGSISTELTTSRNIDGREILLPLIVNGKKVSEADALQHFYDTGEHLGAFSTPEAATAYAQQLHERQATQYGQPPAPPAAASPAPPTPPAPSAAPSLPAPSTDPRAVSYRKFFTPEGGIKEGAPLEMEKKPLEYLATVKGVSLFRDPRTGEMSTQQLLPKDTEDPESWPSYTEEVRDPKTKKVYEERVFYKTDPMKPVGRRRVREIDKQADKPEGAWILDKATGTEVWSPVKYGTRRPKEEKDTSLQDLLKYTRIDSILAGEFPGGAILRGPEYLARRQTLLKQSGLPDDTGLSQAAKVPTMGPNPHPPAQKKKEEKKAAEVSKKFGIGE